MQAEEAGQEPSSGESSNGDASSQTESASEVTTSSGSNRGLYGGSHSPPNSSNNFCKYISLSGPFVFPCLIGLSDGFWRSCRGRSISQSSSRLSSTAALEPHRPFWLGCLVVRRTDWLSYAL